MHDNNPKPEQTPEPPELPPEQAAQFASVEAGEDAADVYIPAGEGATGMPPAARPLDPQGEKYIGPVLTVIFGILASRRGPLWELTPKEQEELTRTGGAVLDYYFELSPSPVGAFLLCLGVAVGPRVALDIQQTKAREEAERKAQAKEVADGDKPE